MTEPEQLAFMPDPSEAVKADLRRELEKALGVFRSVEVHLARHAEANAALHCAERVLYSPLHAKVEAEIAGLEHALARTGETQ